jgi:hypothetical protein
VDRSEARADYADRQTDVNRDAMIVADARFDVSRVRANAIQVAYQLREQAGVSSGSLAQVLATATRASSDRRAKLQLLGFLGLVAGLALGTGLALLRAQLALRRLVLG